MRIKAISMIVCLFLIGAYLAGCKSAAQKPQAPEQNLTQSENLDVNASERRVMANQLSKAAEDLEGVQKASVVVVTSVGGDAANARANNIVAMVGLTVNPSVNEDKERLTAVKQAVTERLKAVDKRISQVLVTTDPTMIKRINDIAAGIVEGKPIQTYQKDVNSLNNDLRKQKVKD